MVAGKDGEATAEKGLCKECAFQIVSVTSRVAIWRRVHRYKLALRNRQDMRGTREGEGGADTEGVGLAHTCSVGDNKSWTEKRLFCLLVQSGEGN